MPLPLPATRQARRRAPGRQACRAAQAGRLDGSRRVLPVSIAASLLALMVAWMLLVAAVAPARGADLPGVIDADGDGVEDILAQWRRGERTWDDLRGVSVAAADAARVEAAKAADEAGPLADGGLSAAVKAAGDGTGPWAGGRLRLLSLGAGPAATDCAVKAAAGVGTCRELFATARFGGVAVLDVDQAGLRALLDAPPPGRLVLDRDGVPALDLSRRAIGVPRMETGAWRLGDDGSFSLAILDSGCDTAHNDLGDPTDDNVDGPPPFVGDAADWYPAENGWPLFEGYKVIGWHDVTDDFPFAAGPWDYHHHGTALASVAAGRGVVSSAYRGVAPAARLVIVKYYDFDLTWHAWAGDFLAACSWLLDRRQELRVGPVLMAVNWDADLGIAAAVDELAAAGLTPVAAMGNYGTGGGGPGWPARLRSALTVGAVNDAGAVAAFSGRGGAVPGKPDLVAPGGGLLPDAGRIDCADNEPNDTYSGRWGTSLAAAHAAGALHLLDEALGEQAVHLPADATSVRTRLAVLRLTAAPVTAVETADGLGTTALPAGTAPREDRGWGLLRVDAAAQALLVPLRPGVDQTDSLLTNGRQPVVARRLDLQRGVRYLLEVLPSPGVDVELVVGDPRDLDDDPSGAKVVRVNQGGVGVSEFTYVTAGTDSWRLLAAKRLSGNGAVVLRVREASAWSQQGATRQLPGAVTGQPNAGSLAGFSGTSFVVPSLVVADPVARSVNVLAADGTHRTGWPVFVFPHPSAQGGLNQPLLWDLDGVAGDEIVVSSAYGSVYFFTAAGAVQTVNLALNRALTAPVGYATAAGQRRVLVVDAVGNAYAWRQGPVQVASAALGHLSPLAPAVGVLANGGAESIVVAFADGRVTALDAQLSTLPGWPRDLGGTPAAAPVLCDLDRDGSHEVVIPVLVGQPATLVFRVLDGNGAPGLGDGATAPAPTGGGWLAVSAAAVCGRPDTGELRVAVTGLATNSQGGQGAAWTLAEAWLGLDGLAGSRVVPGLEVRATSDLGELSLTALLFGPPLAWNHRGGWGTDPATLVHLSWSEVLYGLTAIPGSTSAWFTDTGDVDALAVRRPTLPGGQVAAPLTAVGAALARISSDVLLRLDAQDRQVTITPLADLYASSPLWAGARGDGRNTGAYPLQYGAAAAPTVTAAAGNLAVQPNPGTGGFRFRLSGPAAGPVAFEVYDLRGRRVASFGGPAEGDREAGWDGRDRDGRPLPAGTYLVRARGVAGEPSTRLTIVR